MTDGVREEWLRQEWVHAHEEDAPDTRVFRPAAHPLPPSRGRRTLDLRAPAVLRETRPGPDDRRAGALGRWSLSGHTLILEGDAPGAAAERLEIVSLAPDRLVLRRD